MHQTANERRLSSKPCRNIPLRCFSKQALGSSQPLDPVCDEVSHDAGQRAAECLPREAAQHVLSGRLPHVLCNG